MINADTPSPALARRNTILIVDDALDSLFLLQDLMHQQGYQTFAANTGTRALELAQRLRPDLILLDVMLPDMNGLDACRRLKSEASTAHIPVIFVSGKTDTDDIVAGFDTGCVDYIAKPVRLAEVIARVRAQLRRTSGMDHQHLRAERLQSIVDGIDEGLLLIDGAGIIAYANPASERYLGRPADELSGCRLVDLLDTDDATDYARFFAAPDEPTSRCRGTREVRLRLRDGSLRDMDLSLSPMNSDDARFVVMLHDISHHKRSETALQQAALLDPLTRIANRRHFDAALEQEWQRATRSGQPLSLIVLDVDHFKFYNDSLGHAAGDTCLQTIAETLQAHAQRPADLAARYGGEEFVVLLPETSLAAATELAERVREAIEALDIPNPRVNQLVTASIGVATIVPTLFDDLGGFFVAADRAMYEAKTRGRNQVISTELGDAWGTLRDVAASGATQADQKRSYAG